jgi:hypothetical protein
MPALAGAWRARLRWYPGDWIWASLILLVIAAAGAAVAVASTGKQPSKTVLYVATDAKPVPAPAPPRQATSTPTPAQQRTTQQPPNKQRTLVTWPFGSTAYTVVLSSYPSAGAGATTANSLAHQALAAGLPDVGILDSSRVSSLHPGYLVVFSGVYQSADDAASAQQEAQKLGFGRAYTRQIVS